MSEGRPHRTTVVSRAQEEQPAAGARQALGALDDLLTAAKGRLRDRVVESGRPARRGAEAAIVGVTPVAPPRISSMLFEQRQVAIHALAHLAAEVETARELLAWADRRADRLARRIADARVAETILGLRHGVSLAPDEVVSLRELDVGDEEIEKTIGRAPLVAWAHAASNSDALQNLAESALDDRTTDPRSRSVDDRTTDPRSRSVDDRTTDPRSRSVDDRTTEANDGHAPASVGDEDEAQAKRRARLREAGALAGARDESVRATLAAWGASGAFEAMEAETEPLSQPSDARTTAGSDADGRCSARLGAAAAFEEMGRVTPAVGAAAIDAWAAGALISAHGTWAQKQDHLAALARGAAIAVIALAEPNVPGVGSPRTCAEEADDGRFALFGDKTATLHAPDPELVVVLARTDTTRAGSAGSSLLLASMAREPISSSARGEQETVRSSSAPATGISVEPGGAIAFDGFEVATGAVLGGTAGRAAEQLETVLAAGWFAAAAVDVGVAEAAFEIAANAARERLQGAAPLLRRPRVAARLGRLVVAIAAARRAVAAAARAPADGEGFTAAAIARLASADAARAANAVARDFAALLGRLPPAELAAPVRGAPAFGSDDDVAEALSRRLLA